MSSRHVGLKMGYLLNEAQKVVEFAYWMGQRHERERAVACGCVCEAKPESYHRGDPPELCVSGSDDPEEVLPPPGVR